MRAPARDTLRRRGERIRDVMAALPWQELTTAINPRRGRHAALPGEPAGYVDERIALRRAEVEADERRHRRATMFSSLLGVMFGAALIAGVFATPLFTIRNVEVSGTDDVLGLATEDVIRLSGVGDGANLLLTDVGAVAGGVGTIPVVAAVDVQRQLPSTLKITVTPRVPVAVTAVPGGAALVGADGTILDVRSDADGIALPVVRGEAETALRPGEIWGDVLARRTVSALVELPAGLLPQVREAYFERGQLVFAFEGGLRAILGVPEDVDRKARVLAEVFTDLAARGQAVEYVDVSSPLAPTIRPVAAPPA